LNNGKGKVHSAINTLFSALGAYKGRARLYNCNLLDVLYKHATHIDKRGGGNIKMVGNADLLSKHSSTILSLIQNGITVRTALATIKAKRETPQDAPRIWKEVSERY